MTSISWLLSISQRAGYTKYVLTIYLPGTPRAVATYVFKHLLVNGYSGTVEAGNLCSIPVHSSIHDWNELLKSELLGKELSPT